MESLFRSAQDGGILHGRFDWLVEVIGWLATVIDLCAILILLIGAARFIAGVAMAEVGPEADRLVRTNRRRVELGRYILAGLELFIVSDVIHTALSLAFADLMFLLLLVVIRSIVSFMLERELAHLKTELGE
ncbi:DUF1622 domain-containing protein [Pseudooceanicola sp. LIPI14-2-Ac024]|uniref:DUF1622 domain-containing protein n=1 Tax=Pseudooceanicola sp. LIPI14-2-Ac024 TaxID=3344875 RepID=UPI0035CF290F